MIDKLKQDAREALLKIRTTDERHLELSDTLIETAYEKGKKVGFNDGTLAVKCDTKAIYDDLERSLPDDMRDNGEHHQIGVAGYNRALTEVKKIIKTKRTQHD